jgi:hypothetical protein
VVATALSVSMSFPETFVRGSTTECIYRAKEGTEAALINFNTRSSKTVFVTGEYEFEHQGAQLGQVKDFGDEAYYFNDHSGQATVTTVVVLKDSLQILVTGSGQIDQIGAIARYALTEFEATHAQVTPTSR